MFRRDVADCAGFPFIDNREHAIVRRDEKLIPGCHQNRAAIRAHSRVNDDNVNRAGREKHCHWRSTALHREDQREPRYD